jgi:hypothetical protein
MELNGTLLLSRRRHWRSSCISDTSFSSYTHFRKFPRRQPSRPMNFVMILFPKGSSYWSTQKGNRLSKPNRSFSSCLQLYSVLANDVGIDFQGKRFSWTSFSRMQQLLRGLAWKSPCPNILIICILVICNEMTMTLTKVGDFRGRVFSETHIDQTRCWHESWTEQMHQEFYS